MIIKIVIMTIALLTIIFVYLKSKAANDRLPILSYAYVAALFSIYPLIFSPIQGYYAMGHFKFQIWSALTLSFLLYTIGFIFWGKRDTSATLFRLDAIDKIALCYLALVVISFAISSDKIAALTGADGWYTGLLFQFGIIMAYWGVSRFIKPDVRLIRIVMISAMIVFLLGILHRFQIDPIGIYKSLSEDAYIRFLSTIGQATWYSAYLCVVFPLGLHIFMFEKDNIISGLFLGLSAATLVTQNSDSAYGAFFVVLLIYLVVVLYNEKDGILISKYGYSLILMSTAILVTGICEKICGNRLVNIDPLSLRIAQGFIPLIGIIIGAVLAILGKKSYLHGKTLLFVAIGVLTVALCIVTGMFIVRESAFDVYFTPGKDWGNGRGLIWERTLEMFSDFPLINKLFGIGPGQFSSHISLYTQLSLANAHNEWMTVLVEEGILGCIAYFSIFLVAAIVAIKKIHSSKNQYPRCYGYVVLTTITAYIVHGMFNYQQCISTPMLFVIMALAF